MRATFLKRGRRRDIYQRPRRTRPRPPMPPMVWLATVGPPGYTPATLRASTNPLVGPVRAHSSARWDYLAAGLVLLTTALALLVASR